MSYAYKYFIVILCKMDGSLLSLSLEESNVTTIPYSLHYMNNKGPRQLRHKPYGCLESRYHITHDVLVLQMFYVS